MPTYEYECARCGNNFEKFQSITSPPEKKCPVCKGPVRRLIGSGAALIFKGRGFYATDYRSQEYRESAKREKSSAEVKPESKPEAKAEKS